MSLSGVFGGVIFVELSSSVADEDLLVLLSVPSPESCLRFRLSGSCVNGLPDGFNKLDLSATALCKIRSSYFRLSNNIEIGRYSPCRASKARICPLIASATSSDDKP